jgi:hypothetical protein
MRDEPGSVRKPGGLGACARCQAVVSASELTDAGDGKVCANCRQKSRPAGGTPAQASWSPPRVPQTTPPGPRQVPTSPIAGGRSFGSWTQAPAAAPHVAPQNAAGGAGLGAPAAPGVEAPVGRAVGIAPQATATGGGQDLLAEYAELRRRIAADEDTLPVHRRAGEIASRAGLPIEAIEHYQRCVELNPTDDRLHATLENVRRAAGTADRGVAAPPEPERKVAEEAPPFWNDLGSVFAYPLQGNGRAVLLVGGAFLGIGQLLGAINTFGVAVSVMIFGYCACWLFDVINATGADKKAPPEMPEFASLLETYVFPLFSLVACGLVGFAPFVLSLFMVGWGWLPDGVSLVLPLICFAVGMFTMPMTLLLRAMYQSWSEPLNPSLVLGSIGRVLPDYVALYVALCVAWVLYGVATVALFLVFTLTLGRPSPDAVLNVDLVRIVSWVLYTLVSWPLFLYTWSVQGHLLGRLYRQGMRRLGWFVHGTTEHRAARRFTATLGVGALAATAMLCLGAWGATRAWTFVGGSANAASLMAKCPMKPGSRLTYFWETTDGGGRLTTYCFEGLPDGKLRVTATVRTTENPEFPSTAEELGVMDPANGVFTSVGPAFGAGGDFEGRKGEHVAFYGPVRTSIGSTFVNAWPVRGADRWMDAWNAWKVDAVDPQRASADHFYDQKSGVLVGRFFAGVGFQTKTWLVAVRDVAGATAGPPPSYPFGSLPLDAVLGDPGVATPNEESGVAPGGEDW